MRVHRIPGEGLQCFSIVFPIIKVILLICNSNLQLKDVFSQKEIQVKDNVIHIALCRPQVVGGLPEVITGFMRALFLWWVSARQSRWNTGTCKRLRRDALETATRGSSGKQILSSLVQDRKRSGQCTAGTLAYANVEKPHASCKPLCAPGNRSAWPRWRLSLAGTR